MFDPDVPPDSSKKEEDEDDNNGHPTPEQQKVNAAAAAAIDAMIKNPEDDELFYAFMDIISDSYGFESVRTGLDELRAGTFASQDGRDYVDSDYDENEDDEDDEKKKEKEEEKIELPYGIEIIPMGPELPPLPPLPKRPKKTQSTTSAETEHVAPPQPQPEPTAPEPAAEPAVPPKTDAELKAIKREEHIARMAEMFKDELEELRQTDPDFTGTPTQLTLLRDMLALDFDFEEQLFAEMNSFD